MVQEISPDNFNEILAWLNPDRDVAGAMYVQLRTDLAKIFTWNRCPDPDGLTDQVFDRIGKKVHLLRQTYEGDPRLYFYGVARNLIKENTKKLKALVSLDGIDVPDSSISGDKDKSDAVENCLQECLQTLDREKRELILNYYAKDKQAKIEHRTEMATRLGTSVETLRVRVYRIRVLLEECIERCLNEKTRDQ